jgi:hypothetical protein
MSARTSGGRRSQARATNRPGPHVGPVAVTPLRVTLLIALLGGFGFLGYAVIVRDQLQVPLLATGFAVVGIVLGVMAILSVNGVLKAGRDRRDGLAVITAVAGGLIAVAALLSLAAAVIMGLIWTGTQGS